MVTGSLTASLLEPIESLLEHLWLSEQLAFNTLEGYRRDLTKVARRLQNQQLDWFSVDSLALANAIFVDNEKPSSQARALSACKRLFQWLQEYNRRNDVPTEQLKMPKKGIHLPDIITEAQIDALLSAPDTSTTHGKHSWKLFMPLDCGSVKPLIYILMKLIYKMAYLALSVKVINSVWYR